ncbi:MAG TPA: vitamin K epoxide reductase family protein [Candidatus Binatia bacterium]
MSKASKKTTYGAREAARPIPPRTSPNWLLLGLSLLGMGLTGYLTFSAWQGQAVAFCAAGSACDVALGSQWSKLFGLPTSLWGFFAYASLAGIAFVKRADLHWKLAWMVSLFGVFYSVYLTGVSLIELKSACPYCLSSLVLMSAILGITVYQKPAGLAKFSWTPWLLKTVAVGLLVVVLVHLHYAGIWGTTAQSGDPGLRALADHLAKTDAKFYGASWCPHCQEQKKMFGAAADRLPYVECSPRGPRTPPAAICKNMNIQGYPTWIINGRRFQGLLTPEELAKHSGFQAALR